MSDLLIGCGATRDKRVFPTPRPWRDLVTLDINPDHAPDVLHDLAVLPLPFADEAFDEIHAYEVLEHTGTQGDYRYFFAQFSEFWRILRPGGYLCGSVPLPSSRWAWGDPSHTRVVPRESFVFLDQSEYAKQVGHTAMSDFRWIYQADFRLEYAEDVGESLFFALQAIKPSRGQR
jgi:SAM-dependent methyltransferase